MNLRRMTHEPLKKTSNKLFWNGKIFKILIDEEDELEWTCNNCDALKYRKSENIGLCPNNDFDCKWSCCDEFVATKILKEVK